jgi:Fic family protein
MIQLGKRQQYLLSLSTREPDVYRRELQRFTVELAWKSSSIEGNTYSLLETEELLKTARAVSGHTALETQMILNHKEALDAILRDPKSFSPIKISDVMSLHQLLTAGLNIESGFRRQAVGIIGTNYRPLDNEFALREQLEAAVALANNKDYPLESALTLSGLIAYLQPFADGNKRTARFVGNAILLAHNYAALSYRGVDEIFYKKAVLLIDEQHSFHLYKRMFIEQFLFATDNYFL